MSPRTSTPGPTLVILGLRASGKSTLGPALAARAGTPFTDLDARTLALLGSATVADAWKNLGEPVFRAGEARALEAALAQPPHVLALGGGTPTAPGAADMLRDAANSRRAMLVYLHAPPDTLRARLREGDQSRPSLTGAGLLNEIEAVYAARDPLYRSLVGAQGHIVDATTPTSAQVDAIMAFWKK